MSTIFKATAPFFLPWWFQVAMLTVSRFPFVFSAYFFTVVYPNSITCGYSFHWSA